jgi:hypothetical protein
MPSIVKIGSNNYSGQTAVITFLPDTGGTVNIGTQVIPYNYSTNYFYGTYQLNFTGFNYTCSFNILQSQPLPVYSSPIPNPITYTFNSPYQQDPEVMPNQTLSGTSLSALTTNILIEPNFAGTFEGAISQFRMYTEPLNYAEIVHNFNMVKNNFYMFDPRCPNCGNQIIDDIISQYLP